MKKENLFFLVIPLSQILMVLEPILEKRPFNFWGYAGLIFSIAADILLLYILFRSSGRERMQRKLQELTYLQETEHMQNEILEEKQQKLLLMRSDLEKRLDEIRESLRQGEQETAQREMDEFQESLEKTRPVTYCSNAIVNAVVHEKKKKLHDLKVKTEIDLKVPRGLEIDPLHLCSIFSNLLDNALEALSELPPEQRSFEMHAEIKGAYLFVRVKNTATKEHAFRKRRKGHGYGTWILEYISQNYEGNYQAKYENGWYTVTIMIKVR